MSSTESRAGNRLGAELDTRDKLRLKVLATRTVRAIRIDEHGASLTALTDEGEANIPLAPGAYPARYFRALRDYLSDMFLNLPGGYPAHIGRWTRMDSLHRDPGRLLLLGDNEAVVAVACSGALDARLAADVWWCAQSMEIALALLRHDDASDWAVAPALAEYVLEFLPFEESSATVTDALGRILQPGLLDAQRVKALWQRGRRRHTWRSGFFLGHPALYPDDQGNHPGMADLLQRLRRVGMEAHPLARLLLHSGEAEFRNTLAALLGALDKPQEREVVALVFREICRRMHWPGDSGGYPREVTALIASAADLIEQLGSDSPQLLTVLHPGETRALESLALLSRVSEELLSPVFGGNTFGGTVMRRHLDPLLQPLSAAAKAILHY